ncbi:MAG: hypothetical protein GVY17_06825 [Cyanobacteria bacterium]|jgi:hypothetical protein|nr:hypothetical protein [Cyanobacteria bacterium GSL.Bin21]
MPRKQESFDLSSPTGRKRSALYAKSFYKKAKIYGVALPIGGFWLTSMAIEIAKDAAIGISISLPFLPFAAAGALIYAVVDLVQARAEADQMSRASVQ